MVNRDNTLQSIRKNDENRLIYMDNIKGLLILLVVLGHCLFNYRDSHYIDFFVVAIYFVHMPAFVFTTGFFSKSEKARSIESCLKFIFAYIFIISIYIGKAVIDGGSIHLLSTYYSEWYMMALVIWRLLATYLKKSKWTVFALICFAVVAGFWPDLGGNSTLAINKVITFFPFFFAGFLIDNNTIDSIRKDSLKTKIQGWILLVSVAAGIIISYKTLDIRMPDVLPQAYPETEVGYAVNRIIVFLIAAAFIVALLQLSPEKKVPFLTKAGKNCFAIYLIHRPLTLVFSKVFQDSGVMTQVVASVIFSFVLITVLGSDVVTDKLNQFLGACVNCLTHNRSQRFGKVAIAVFLSLLLLIPAGMRIHWNETEKADTASPAPADVKYRIISDKDKNNFDEAYTLLFCGDLILLEDQVKNAFTGTGYDFSLNFEYTKEYISDADYAMGVFEGPLGGTAKNYSSSNYEDGKKLYLNYPDEWADAVKDAGFDLVTLANNHILDMGEKGKDRTIDVLKKKDIDFVGAFKSEKEKNSDRVKIVESEGIRFAVLSYTYGANGYSTDDLTSGSLANATSLIVDPDDAHYKKILKEVRGDFARAKELNADLIVVLPHWGTQFKDEPDDFQKSWQKTFVDLGADIILGDHTHSVQPVGIDSNGVFTLYCPGNYANIYREHNGDCSALVEVYIDRKEKTVIGGAIIPMWTTSSIVGNYRAIPINSISTDEKIGETITTYDLKRIKKVQKHITKTMLGTKINSSMLQERYYFDKDGFMRTKAAPITISDQMKRSPVYSLLTTSESVCFVGDSVTEGTKNGGAGWYEPLEQIIPGEIYNRGWGSATTKVLLDKHLDEIVNTKAELYVIAIGTNDVRYRNEDCAMNPEDYVANLQRLREAIVKASPDAKFVFIAPWTSTDGDKVSKLPYDEKIAMNTEYSKALEKWAESIGDIYVDANKNIDYYLSHYPQSYYLIDYIHPNYLHGIALYSQSVLLESSTDSADD